MSRFRKIAIFCYDGWECHLCGRKVRQVKSAPGVTLPDDAATIDHVVPVSKGGTNATRNLRTCCYRCNTSKGDTCQGEPRPGRVRVMKAFRSAASCTG